jgi:DNA-binding winged helix-turn-helix (wHTH) protein
LTVRFGGFEFDEGRRQLFRGGEPVPLEPKAFELLRLLISRRPEAVPRADIHEALWQGALVSESSLPGLIRDLRAVLGDDAAAPKFIRTLPRFGYAFCAEVSGAARSTRTARVVHGGEALPLLPGENVLGRDEDVTVRIDARGVSRRHARIVAEGDRFTLEDMGSKNGTFLNGRRLEAPAELQDGDRLDLGRTSLVFRSRGWADPTQTE